MKWLKELRVTHYLKNSLVFVPAFFGGELFVVPVLGAVAVVFACFCMGASAIYLMNDIKDIEKDRLHPVKCHRPLAAGEISTGSARIVCVFLVAASYALLLASDFGTGMLLVFSAYLLINVLYSVCGWKNIPLVDVVILVAGFYLRVQAGAVAASVQVSPWLSLVILSGAGFLGFGKRRNEQKVVGSRTREVLDGYPAGFLDKVMYAFLVMTNVFFALWCVLEKSQEYLILFPFVLLICLKYSMDLEQEQNHGDPMDVILKDKSLFMIGVLAGVIMLILLYGQKG